MPTSSKEDLLCKKFQDLSIPSSKHALNFSLLNSFSRSYSASLLFSSSDPWQSDASIQSVFSEWGFGELDIWLFQWPICQDTQDTLRQKDLLRTLSTVGSLLFFQIFGLPNSSHICKSDHYSNSSKLQLVYLSSLVFLSLETALWRRALWAAARGWADMVVQGLLAELDLQKGKLSLHTFTKHMNPRWLYPRWFAAFYCTWKEAIWWGALMFSWNEPQCQRHSEKSVPGAAFDSAAHTVQEWQSICEWTTVENISVLALSFWTSAAT